MGIIGIEQIETPALLIDMDVLESNISKMAGYFADKKPALRPHFKTFKCPAIAHMLLRAGAKGVTCAKLGEAQALAEAGVGDILIANQIVDDVKIDRLAGLAKNTRITVCADDARNVAALSRAAAAHGSTIYVLIEVDVGMGRCGINTKEEALALARQIRSSAGLSFEGIQAYAGQLSHVADRGDRVRGTLAAEEKVISIKTCLEADGFTINEISGAGTGTFDIPGKHDIWTEVQAGSYVFMDTDYIKLGLGFETALTVLTTVIHKRPGFAVTDAGLKVCCTANGNPAIRALRTAPIISNTSVITLSEEHGTLADPGDALSYLQKLEYVPSHCCSTVNLHDYYYCVRGGLLESVWRITGRGKSM